MSNSFGFVATGSGLPCCHQGTELAMSLTSAGRPTNEAPAPRNGTTFPRLQRFRMTPYGGSITSLFSVVLGSDAIDSHYSAGHTLEGLRLDMALSPLGT